MAQAALNSTPDWQVVAVIAALAFVAGIVAAFIYYRCNGPHLVEERETARRHARLAEQSNRFLRAALDAVPAGLAFFDRDGRFVAWNEQYASHVREHAGEINDGETFESIVRRAVTAGRFPDAEGREDAWIAERLRRFKLPATEFEQHVASDRWLRIEERTIDQGGGRINIITDITDLKRR